MAKEYDRMAIPPRRAERKMTDSDLYFWVDAYQYVRSLTGNTNALGAAFRSCGFSAAAGAEVLAEVKKRQAAETPVVTIKPAQNITGKNRHKRK